MNKPVPDPVGLLAVAELLVTDTSLSPREPQLRRAVQEARHRADYDPHGAFHQVDVADRINLAVKAMAAFDRVSSEEQADVLAFMMVKPRP